MVPAQTGPLSFSSVFSDHMVMVMVMVMDMVMVMVMAASSLSKLNTKSVSPILVGVFHIHAAIG